MGRKLWSVDSNLFLPGGRQGSERTRGSTGSQGLYALQLGPQWPHRRLPPLPLLSPHVLDTREVLKKMQQSRTRCLRHLGAIYKRHAKRLACPMANLSGTYKPDAPSRMIGVVAEDGLDESLSWLLGN